MKKEDFGNMPKGFIRCYKTDCKCRETCLRAQATLYTTSQWETITVINPDLATGDTDCNGFLSTEPVHIAWGMRKLVDCIPHGNAGKLRSQLIKAYGYYHFYRMRRGEDPIYPEEQENIIKLIRRNGGTDLPEFDRYTDDIRWV